MQYFATFILMKGQKAIDLAIACLLSVTVSTDLRNTLVKFFCRCFFVV